MATKWGASAKSWNNSRNQNLQRAADEYSNNDLVQALQDQINNYYNNGTYGKYYFRQIQRF